MIRIFFLIYRNTINNYRYLIFNNFLNFPKVLKVVFKIDDYA